MRSQSGRILTDTIADGAAQYASSYNYDTDGRLIAAATITHHQLSYGFGTAACGADAAAGKDGNRTSFSDSKDGAAAATTTYCYDNADRLTGTTVPASGPTVTLAQDALVSANSTTGTVTTGSFSTTHAGDVLVALVQTDGPGSTNSQTETVTGAGLTWTLVTRAN